MFLFISHVYLEYHYDNPTLVPNLVDNSGIRFTYTEMLRQYDSGLLVLGTVYDSIIIPPQVPDTNIIGYCYGGLYTGYWSRKA